MRHSEGVGGKCVCLYEDGNVGGGGEVWPSAIADLLSLSLLLF